MTGHLLGGAGALEAIATVLAHPPPRRPADDQPRRPGRRGRARHRRPPPRDLPVGRHRRAEQLVRLRRRTTSPSPSGARDDRSIRAHRRRNAARSDRRATAPGRPAQPAHAADRAASTRARCELISRRGRLRHARRRRPRRRHAASWRSAPTRPSGRRDGRRRLQGRRRRLPPRDDRRRPDHRALALRRRPAAPRACCRCTRSAGSSRR